SSSKKTPQLRMYVVMPLSPSLRTSCPAHTCAPSTKRPDSPFGCPALYRHVPRHPLALYALVVGIGERVLERRRRGKIKIDALRRNGTGEPLGVDLVD